MKDLLRLRRKARGGNKRALNALISRHNKLAQRANRMLDVLEKHGRTKQAYASAQGFLYSAYDGETNRFKTNLTDPNAIYQQAIAIEHFLSLKTSTLIGAKRVDDARVAAFRNRFPDNSKGMSKKQILDFFEFLSNESVDSYLNESSEYQSDDEVDNFLIAMNDVGRTSDEIIEMLDRYNESFNNPSPNQDERFYYDDLVKWFKGGIDIVFEGRKIKITKRG